jgi:hypothetical protein
MANLRIEISEQNLKGYQIDLNSLSKKEWNKAHWRNKEHIECVYSVIFSFFEQKEPQYSYIFQVKIGFSLG